MFFKKKAEKAVSSGKAFPLETQRERVPWFWLPLMTIPNLASGYIEFCSGGPMTFALRKFTDDPQTISFLISINTLFNFLVAAGCSFMSDHVWTRFGRRRVFLIPGWFLVSVCMFFVPLAPGLKSLALTIVLYQFFQDFGASSLGSLNYEVVPRPQRGRYAMYGTIVGSLMGLFYNKVLLKQYDNQYTLDNPLPWGPEVLNITGEHVVYWYGSFFVMLVVCFLTFCVRERKPEVMPVRQKVSFLQWFKEVFGDPVFRKLYVLCIGVCIVVAGLATNTVLLVTEQFKYSKAQFGEIQVYNMFLNLLILAPLLGNLVDRVKRLRMVMTGLIGIACLHTSYFLYLKFFAPGGVPPFGVLIALGLLITAFNTTYAMSHSPNLYDYIPSNKMGTFNSGMGLLIGMLLFLMPNLYGTWVKYYSRTFCAPGTYDYTSAYYLYMVLAGTGLLCIFRFRHWVKTGQIVPIPKNEK